MKRVLYKKWSKNEELLIINNYHHMTLIELTKLFSGRSKKSVDHRIRLLGLDKMKQWTHVEDFLLRALYGQLPYKELEKRFKDRTIGAILSRAKRLGIKSVGSTARSLSQKTYLYDNDFFSRPGVVSSYWAGFIAADGCVQPKYNKVKISLSSKDADHLRRFYLDCNYTGKVSVYSRCTSESVAGFSAPGSLCAEACLCGAQKVIKDLQENFNLGPRKTFSLGPPNIYSDELILSYMIGFIDGDGCLYDYYANVTTRKGTKSIVHRLYCEVGCASRKFLEWFKFCMDKFSPPVRNGPVSSIKVLTGANGSTAELYRYRLGGQRVVNFIELSSKLKIPRLRRKWEPAFNFVRSKGREVEYDYYSF